MLNFCVFVFIIYAVAGSAKQIIFGSRSKRHSRRRYASVNYAKRNRTSRIIKLSNYQQNRVQKSKIATKVA